MMFASSFLTTSTTTRRRLDDIFGRLRLRRTLSNRERSIACMWIVTSRTSSLLLHRPALILFVGSAALVISLSCSWKLGGSFLPAVVKRKLPRLFSTSSSSSSSSSSSVDEMRSLSSLHFDNRNLRLLPVDASLLSGSRQVPNSIFSLVNPTPVSHPVVLAASKKALSLLGVNGDVSEGELADYLSGNRVLPGSQTAAHCYCGHQFGSFAGQLGDGAAISLGEVINPINNERWELQLKGAGPTPFSRGSDGRKVLRSSVREFLCSETMAALQIPTTRAAACVTSSSTVERDPLYSGKVINEKCTVVSRIAENFFRFGSFEIFKEKPKGPAGQHERQGPSAGNQALKKQLLDHILLFFPDIHGSDAEKYEKYFETIVKRTARLVALWQSVGFVHGVLNTDNMSVMGVTIDYGPFGFMETFDPDYVPNGSDHSGRYAYQHQPAICKWNLMKFAEALNPLLPQEISKKYLDRYDDIFTSEYQCLMREKLGLLQSAEGDASLFKGLFETMTATYADFTDVFVALTEFHAGSAKRIALDSSDGSLRDQLLERLLARSSSPQNVVNFFRRKLRVHRLSMQPAQIEQLWHIMQTNESNLSEIFDGAPLDDIKNEITGSKRTLDILVTASKTIKDYEQMTPEQKQTKDREMWSKWLQTYFDRLKKENNEGEGEQHRVSVMRARNPTLILRNWMAQEAIDAAEKKNDFNGVRTLLSMLDTPFEAKYSSFLHNDDRLVCRTDGKGASIQYPQEGDPAACSEQEEAFLRLPPEWADSLICTCSS